jgi:hypothetical protein
VIRVLVVAGDPGGASAVAPVIEALSRLPDCNIVPYAYNEAVGIWRSRQGAVTTLPEDCTIRDIRSIITETSPDLLLTATSYNGKMYETAFITVARESGIKTLAVLDYWNNYAIRFRDSRGIPCLPDKIAVMDERARKEMIDEGFDPQSLIITGHPAYDDLNAWRENFSAEQGEAIRKQLGIAQDNFLVLFASEIQYATLPGDPFYPGYTNREIITALIAALDVIAAETGRGITLLIRPHPRESTDLFEGLKGDLITVTVSGSGHGRDLALTADLVTGMTTNLLVEACYLGCIVLSLQHRPLLPDPLITNHLGVSRAVYEKKDFKPAVQEVLTDSGVRDHMRQKLQAFRTDGKAASRIVQLIRDMVQFTE